MTAVSLKKEIIKIVIERLREKLTETKYFYKQSKQGAREAPGRMQSHHDPTKKEMNLHAENLEKIILEITNGILDLENFKPENLNEIIKVGSIIEVEELKTEKKIYYFILPYGAGEIVECPFLKKGPPAGGGRLINSKITIITPQSPLGQKLINQHVGAIIEINFRKLFVVNIF